MSASQLYSTLNVYFQPGSTVRKPENIAFVKWLHAKKNFWGKWNVYEGGLCQQWRITMCGGANPARGARLTDIFKLAAQRPRKIARSLTLPEVVALMRHHEENPRDFVCSSDGMATKRIVDTIPMEHLQPPRKYWRDELGLH